jgi:hypothetical protein
MTFQDKLISLGHATKETSRILQPVTFSGFYKAENDYSYFVAILSPGITRVGKVGYSDAFIEANRTAPVALDEESETEYEAHIAHALGL